MNRLLSAIEEKVLTQTADQFKETVITLFQDEIITEPTIPLGRIQPYELIVNLHNSFQSPKKAKYIKELLFDLLLEYHNTECNFITYQTIKCFEEISFAPFLELAYTLFTEHRLVNKYYNELNLELLLVGCFKTYKLDKRLKMALIETLSQSEEIEEINSYLELFINKNIKKGISLCFERLLRNNTIENVEMFITQYIGSLDNLIGSDYLLEYQNLCKKFDTAQVDSLFSLLNQSFIDETEWEFKSYNYALNCIIKARNNTLTLPDYALFYKESIHDQNLIFQINSLLRQYPKYVHYMKTVNDTHDLIPNIYKSNS